MIIIYSILTPAHPLTHHHATDHSQLRRTPHPAAPFWSAIF